MTTLLSHKSQCIYQLFSLASSTIPSWLGFAFLVSLFLLWMISVTLTCWNMRLSMAKALEAGLIFEVECLVSVVCRSQV